MKKIGVMTDIHNNAVALEAVLNVFDAAQCEEIICCGDIVGIGPFPQQTVDKVMCIPGLIAVSGNHDRYLSEGIPEQEQMDAEEIAYHQWEREKLSKPAKDFITALPARIDLEIEAVTITVLHYPMNNRNEYYPLTGHLQAKDFSRLLGGINSSITIFGHDHRQISYETGRKKYLNCGPLGCPSATRNIARGGILTVDNEHAAMDFIAVPYDVQKVIDEIDKINYPCADSIKHIFYGIK